MKTKYTYKILNNIAKQYKTRTEFRQRNPGAHSTAYAWGVMDSICDHMFSHSYSYPQLIIFEVLQTLSNTTLLYNDRVAIAPYELDIYAPSLKFAIEYDGYHWHKDAKDPLFKERICTEQKITLLTITGPRNSSNVFEQTIASLKQVIDKLPKELNVTLETIAAINKDIILNKIHDKVLDVPLIKTTIAKYTTLKDFRSNEPTTYNKLRTMGVLKDYIGNLKRRVFDSRIDWAKEEIAKYTSYEEFKEKSYQAYIYLKSKKLLHLADNLTRSKAKPQNWAQGTLQQEIAKYSFLYDFLKQSPSAHDYIRHHTEFKPLLEPLQRKPRKGVKRKPVPIA